MEHLHSEELNKENKILRILRASYLSSILALFFGMVCFILIDVTKVIPHVLVGFACLNFLTTYFLQKKIPILHLSTLSFSLALIGAFAITLYSGGINSPFIFVLFVVVLGGYLNSQKFVTGYSAFVFLLILLVFTQSFSEFKIVENVVPLASKSIFSLLSILIAIYFLINIFSVNLIKTHQALHDAKNNLELQLNEKETLLKEVHHRIKNNLQTVSSLLSLQSRTIDDISTKGLLKNTQNRVISMAMVHEMLYMRKDIARIEYKPYVTELTAFLMKSIKGADSAVQFRLDIPDIKLGIDTAIPLGLLINETITNALKYGFNENEKGEIYLKIEKIAEENYLLYIGDNGKGFSENITYKTTASLGLKLIHNLTRQLRGTITRDLSKKGTNYVIKFTEISQSIT